MRASPQGDAPFQQERTDLIDDAGALTDQSVADAVQCLKVELIGGLGRDELHGRALDRLGDGFRISGLGRTKLYELIGSGQLVTTTIGRRRLVIVRSLLQLVDTTISA
jgi:hypothetical protein